MESRLGDLRDLVMVLDNSEGVGTSQAVPSTVFVSAPICFVFRLNVSEAPALSTGSLGFCLEM